MLRRIAAMAVLGGVLAVAWGQSTRPAISPAYEVRALAAFDSGDYVAALPMLRKIEASWQDDPRRVGPIQERIRVCQRALAGNAPAAPPSPPQTRPAAPRRQPHLRPAEGSVLEVTIKQLGNFEYDMEKPGHVPEDVLKLDGVKVRTRGFMIPLSGTERIREFALVPSLFACCFGQPAGLQHTVMVHTPKGKAVAYIDEEISVEGTLKVEEKKEDGVVVSLFEIECVSVKAVK